VRKRFFKTEQEKLAALMNDKRYERAVETIFGKDDGGESGVVIPIFDESKFEHAKRQLIAEDVAADTAEANLRKIVAAVVVNVDSQIDACLEYAAQLDQAGEWDKSAEVYAKVILALPDADPRKAKARNLLTSMIEKRNASAAENAQQGSSAE
jgi:alkyl sulfatase BDS1-like metallo-beta-lactamase superfamily hydrolase